MISPELLRRYGLFAGLPHDLFESIAQFSDELTLEPDTYLFEQGDSADELYLIMSGSVDLLIDMDDEGRERSEVETVVDGEAVGWSALIEPFEYTMSAAALTKTHVIIIDAVKLREVLEAHPQWGYRVMQRVAKIIGERLTNMRLRLMSLGS